VPVSSPTFSLRVADLHWLPSLGPELDLCAHWMRTTMRPRRRL
jgi:hypothetical protein